MQVDLKSPLEKKSIFVKKSTIHGYGVFANEEIKEGAIIEECYVLTTELTVLSLTNYLFSNHEGVSALPLGFGCIYNHSANPNADYLFEAETPLLTITAIRLIKKGEEICISYGDEWFKLRKMKVKNISESIFKRKLLSFFLLLVRFGLLASILLIGLKWLSGIH